MVGPDYPTDPDFIESFAVVLTSYDNIRREYDAFLPMKSAVEGKKDGIYTGPLPRRGSYPLMVITWGTLIADEVTKITRSSSKTSLAARALEARKRIGMTGTPLENDYVELQTLLEFLRIKPWDSAITFNSVRKT